MKRALRTIAVFVAVGAVAFWLAAGANRGWTKTSVEKTTLDEVTGIEGRTYEKRFVPGVDFLAVTIFGAGVLVGVSFLFRKSTKPKTES